jgi:glycylpeptide N-tetradecanoyltransferase
MASYKFWSTQPVTRFDDSRDEQDGPIKIIDPEKVSKEPRKLYDGFEWVTVDLTDEAQLTEVHELLTGHYVEDADATFRLTYTASFLNWALKSPGWKKDWHIGVRAIASKKLVAFISGVPVMVRVRDKSIKCSEVNFMCVHKKLRSKRLAPVLIEEVTRRCYLSGTYQAAYTGGTVLPTPVTSCRYFHRPLDWLKLYDVGFSGMPRGSTKQRQVTKNFVPSATALPGFRLMEKKDVKEVHNLLVRYLKRFMLAPEFTEEEIEHMFLHNEKLAPEQVVWTYVVEDPKSQKVTDVSSFYLLESAVIGNQQHDSVRAAYSYYYASESAFEKDEKVFTERLNALVLDTLVMAKKVRCSWYVNRAPLTSKQANFDVFNALTLLDNPLFLEKQKFGPGDGQLHYYLYNYRAKTIPGGVDTKNQVDASKRGGCGMVFF